MGSIPKFFRIRAKSDENSLQNNNVLAHQLLENPKRKGHRFPAFIAPLLTQGKQVIWFYGNSMHELHVINRSILAYL